MSYKVLARKWRPQRFDEMLGQEPVLRALVNALDTDRLHHAYLFTGMRGVGKTSIARIFAKCLNCLENGVSSAPCGRCSACSDIEAGRFLDLIEVDAASRTKVDETRELLENVPYAPSSGRYKVYLIDEVHMFSNASFNALLKTLEEPPEHVKFLLATTDPQKVPVTVLSRCLQFNLRRMAPDALAEYLEKILGQESIEAERAALDLIARASEGSVRDSLSLVEQAAAYGEGAVRLAEVEAMLGRVSTQRLAVLLETLATGDLNAVFAQIDELATYAPDFSEILGELLGLLHRAAMLQSLPDTADGNLPGHQTLAGIAASVAPEEIQLWYQIGQHARRDMPFAPDPREGFDMAVLRMHGFRPQTAPLQEALGDAGDAPAAAPAPRSSPSQATRDAAVKPQAQDSGDAAALPKSDAGGGLPVLGSVSAGDARDARAAALSALQDTPTEVPVDKPSAAAAKEPAPAAAESSVPSAAAANGSLAQLTPDAWVHIVADLGVSGMPRQLASNTVIDRRDGNTLYLTLAAGQDHLDSPRFIERLAQAISSWAGEVVSLSVRLADSAQVPLSTPSNLKQQDDANALESARASIDGDQRLARLLNDIDGTIDPANVRPLSPSTD